MHERKLAPLPNARKAPGVGGGGGPRFSSAGRPTTVAEIYDPSKPIGQRWSTAADSQIPRLYHSTAQLTPNADVSPELLACNLQKPAPIAGLGLLVQHCYHYCILTDFI